MRMGRGLIPLAAAACIAGCGFVPTIPGVTPYRIEIQQGNYISQEMVTQLKPGMSKEQVRLALGTPLLNDVFHADRWDYVYWREKRRMAIFFEDGKLARVDGDSMPPLPTSAAGR